MFCLPYPEVGAHGEDGCGHEETSAGHAVVETVREVVYLGSAPGPPGNPGGKRQAHGKNRVVHWFGKC